MNNIIKKDNLDSLNATGGISNMKLSDIAGEVKKYIDETKSQCNQMIANAKNNVEAIKKEAYDEGYKNGFKQGMNDGNEKGRAEALEEGRKDAAIKLVELRELLLKLTSSIEDKKSTITEQTKKNVFALSLKIAEIITKKQISIDPAILKSNIESAISLIVNKTNLSILINPEDENNINTFMQDIRNHFIEIQSISIKTDPSVKKGGCVLLTDESKIDNDISSQLTKIEKLLME